jgi:hypothetical protein
MDEIKESFNDENKPEPAAEEPKEEPEAASKANLYFLIGVGVIIILFAAVFALKFFARNEIVTIDDMIAKTLAGDENPETNYMYNGYVFVKVGPLWYTKWRYGIYEANIPLHYGPLELEDIYAEGQLDERFDSGHYYITYDPNTTDAAYVAIAISEIGRNLIEGLGAGISYACSHDDTACANANRPVITCENTNSSVIYAKESEEPKIVRQGNCLVLQGRGEDLLKVTDRAILQMYGIMK